MDLSVSVIVTTFRREATLASILAPLLSDASTMEIVVVDDASPDGTAELLAELSRRDRRVRPVFAEGNVGPAAARRLGAEIARGDVLVVIDDDVLAAPGLVSGHLAHHEAIGHRLVLGYMPIEPRPAPASGNFATREYAEVYERQADRFEREPESVLRHLWGGNFSVRRDDFLAATAGYDFPIRYFEDRDLGLRFERYGLQGVFDRSLRATHLHERTLDSYLRDGRNSGQGFALLHRMHEDLIGPYDIDDSLRGYPTSLRATIRAADLPGVRRVAPRLLTVGTTLAGERRLWRVETRLGLIGKVLAEREGVRSVQRAGPGPAELASPVQPATHRVIVAIPTKDRPDQLARCLRAMAPARERSGIPVLVADSSGPELADRVAEVCGQYPWVRLHRHGGTNVAMARNECIRVADADLIVMADDDVQVEPQAIDALVETYEDACGPRVVGGSVRWGDDWWSRPMKLLPFGFARRCRAGERPDFLNSALILFPRAYGERWPFNERIRIGEDIFMSGCWRAAGIQLLWAPAGRAVHDPGDPSYGPSYSGSVIYANLFLSLFVERSPARAVGFELLGFASGVKAFRRDLGTFVTAWLDGHRLFLEDRRMLERAVSRGRPAVPELGDRRPARALGRADAPPA